jgi:tyrosyl-tRNA synthetase
VPENIEKTTIKADAGLMIANAMKEAGMTASTSESYRMIKQGAVKVNGEKVSDKQLLLESGSEYLVQVGKRKFSKITIA